ncbi:MAG TPA: hypothetical protein VKF40_30315 [Burkholderiales bacterium]|nr:hypothetical protein [Burkholderiales bacterium]
MPHKPPRSDFLIVAGLYVGAHGLMLLNNGLYWDDWTIFGFPYAAVTQWYREYGLPLFGYYHLVLDSLGVPAYRILVFLSYLVSAACLYGILTRVREIDRRTAFVLALFFVLFPSNSARISVMASRTSLCYALFFAGFWLACLYLDKRVPALRVAALILLCASFLTHSFLVFYIVVLIYIAYHEKSGLGGVRALPGFVLRYLDFFALPVIFWIIKLLYFEPYGSYEGYNRITLGSALNGFFLIGAAFYGGFVEPLVASFRLPLVVLIAAAILSCFGARLIGRMNGSASAQPLRLSFWFLVLGIVLFVAGVFAYLAVGKVPSPYDWNSRHQLLTPLGASLILVYLPRLILAERVQNLVYALLVAAFLAADVQQWVVFQKDWYKQVALIESFKESPEIRRGHYFLIQDKTADLDANHRVYRFYEYTGLFHAAFGDERRLGQEVRSFRVQDFNDLRSMLNSQFRLGEYDASVSSPDAVLIVEHGELKLTPWDVIRLRFLEWSDTSEFHADVKHVVRVSVVENVSVVRHGRDITVAPREQGK